MLGREHNLMGRRVSVIRSCVGHNDGCCEGYNCVLLLFLLRRFLHLHIHVLSKFHDATANAVPVYYHHYRKLLTSFHMLLSFLPPPPHATLVPKSGGFSRSCQAFHRLAQTMYSYWPREPPTCLSTSTGLYARRRPFLIIDSVHAGTLSRITMANSTT